jgi:gliding motility-associated protein GldM
MSGGDLPPRQKMIGMMYLVLTALLALNVSKDILDAFVLVNDGLENTVVNYDEKNRSLYDQFKEAKLIDEKKVAPFWEKAQKAQSFSATIIDYLENLKIKLVKETEKISQSEADTLQLKYVLGKDNYDIPTQLLIGQPEDGSAGLARELKNKLEEYKTMMSNLFDAKDQKTLSLDLKTADIHSAEGVQNWEMGNFYHTPLAASVTLLSKIQTDIKNVEYEVVNKLFQSVDKDNYKFDTIAAKIIPNSNYVMLGKKYNADVFVAAFSTTQNPTILIGKYDSTTNALSSITDTVPVNKGLGSYSVNTNKEGIFSYEGLINLTSPSGELKSYPFKSEYIVAKPSLVVSPDRMNVFYIGPKNPVSISVPGVASENIKATINGSGNRITKIANGKYEVKLSPNSPRNVRVTVNATMPDGSTRNMGNMPFLAKKLPQPTSSVGGKSGEFSVRRVQLRGYRTVKASYGKDFLFTGLPLTIINCKIQVYRNGVAVFEENNMKSKNLTSETKSFFLNNARRKDKIYLSSIRVKDINGQTQTLSGIQITVQ